MLLAFDTGNSNIVVGVFRDDNLIASWRLATDARKTADEYGLLIKNMFQLQGIDGADIHRVIISSVVPDLTQALVEVAERYLKLTPLIVGAGIKTGLPIRYENPKEVGADRIVNAVAGIEAYGAPLVLVDFGTATTICVINDKGEYLGGAITAGIGISMEALFNHAAKLPKVALVAPEDSIGRTTTLAMQSGLVYGYAALVDGMIDRLGRQLGLDGHQISCVATGGGSEVICPHCQYVNHIDPLLTLRGLYLLSQRNEDTGPHA